MTDDLVERLRKWDYGKSTWALLEDAADRIEMLEASEAEWQPICDSYANENQRFADRIEKLEAALVRIGVWNNFEDRYQGTINELIHNALEKKDG